MLEPFSKIHSIYNYREKNDLSLWVDYVPRGKHPERMFHSHLFMEIVLVRGSGVHLLEDENVPLCEGDVLIIPPGFTHAYAKCGNLEIINLVYEPHSLPIPWLDAVQLPLFSRLFPEKGTTIPAEMAAAPVFQLQSADLDRLWQEIQQIGNYINTFLPGNNFLALGLSLRILGELASRSGGVASRVTTHQECLQKTILFMVGNLEKNLTMSKLAAQAMMSERNFYRYFKHMTGFSPLQYLISLRVKRAVQLMCHDTLSRDEVAQRCGFCDANYMGRILKQQLKQSPRSLFKGQEATD